MANLLHRLVEKKLLCPPPWLADSVQYVTIMGSQAYGVSDDSSDMDLYGFCIPEKHLVFPHLAGEIHGFGRQLQRFEQYQQHHVNDTDAGKEYDVTIFSITKYFQLCMENNPNMIDSLFTPQNAILHASPIAQMVRDRRRMFLHKGAWHKFKGYAYSQVHKMRSKENPESLKRQALVEQFGYDVKFAYHVVRLINEVEQILTEGDLDLQRNREQLKAIRRGEWTQEQIYGYFETKERELEKAYTESKLPHSPDETAIKQLLVDCLEHHYGDLSSAVVIPDEATQTLRAIAELCKKAGF